MITAWILSIIGLAACCAGYRMIKNIIALWGFLLGGALGAILVGNLMVDAALVERAAGFFIGGLIGAGLAFPLYRLIIFISGAVLGLTLANVFVGLLPEGEPALRLVLTLTLVFLTGGMALALQKFTLILSTAFFGAALLLSGPLHAAGLSADGILRSFSTSSASSGALPAGWYVAWILVGMIGTALQFHHHREND